MEELQKAVDIKATNKQGAIDILHSIGKNVNQMKWVQNKLNFAQILDKMNGTQVQIC
jgi:hypothetical protein